MNDPAPPLDVAEALDWLATCEPHRDDDKCLHGWIVPRTADALTYYSSFTRSGSQACVLADPTNPDALLVLWHIGRGGVSPTPSTSTLIQAHGLRVWLFLTDEPEAHQKRRQEHRATSLGAKLQAMLRTAPVPAGSTL